MAKTGQRGEGRIRVGVGGWTYEPWRETFFPRGLAKTRELAYASSKLTSIEINGTFYRTQTPSTFAKWRDETPDDFVFAVKAPRYVVQKRALAESGESILRFLDSGLSELGDKLGPILWQFAPTKKFDRDDLAAFLKLLPRELHGGRRLRHALEVRHESFACAAFVDLARDAEAAIVVACDSKHPQIAGDTADFRYLRVMGTQQSEATGYGDAALSKWADRAHALAQGRAIEEFSHAAPSATRREPRDVFLYFISGYKAHNPAAAAALIAKLR